MPTQGVLCLYSSFVTSFQGASRTSSRNPKRLSAEFPIQVSVPLLTPSSATQSVPPSPLKTEFTSTPPVGVKTLPVLYAARELQFDREQHIKEEVVDSSGKIIEDNQKPSSKCLPKKVTEKTDHKDVSKIPSRSSSATRIDEQLTSSVDSQQERVETAAKGSVSVDNLSQVIEDLEANDGNHYYICYPSPIVAFTFLDLSLAKVYADSKSKVAKIMLVFFSWFEKRFFFLSPQFFQSVVYRT